MFEAVYAGQYTISLYEALNLRLNLAASHKPTKVIVECALGTTHVKRSRVVNVPVSGQSTTAEYAVTLFNGLVPEEDVVLNPLEGDCWVSKMTLKLYDASDSPSTSVLEAKDDSSDSSTLLSLTPDKLLGELSMDLIPYINRVNTVGIEAEVLPLTMFNEFIDQRLPAGDMSLQVRFLRIICILKQVFYVSTIYYIYLLLV